LRVEGHGDASCSYWDPAQDVAVAQCHAAWVTDRAEGERVWAFLRGTPPPLGHDPALLWPDGAASPDAGLLRLDPWRLRAGYAADLAAGRPPFVLRLGGRGTIAVCASSLP
jgi:hypothetical protein